MSKVGTRQLGDVRLSPECPQAVQVMEIDLLLRRVGMPVGI